MPIAVRGALQELGALIAAARREQGLTRDQLAQRVGVERRTIGRVERGAPGVAIGWFLTAAWILGLPVLRSSDFATGRDRSAVGVFLERLEAQLPRRVRLKTNDVDDDF